MADAFDRAWDTVKRWPGEVEEVSDLRPPHEQMALPADQMPFEGDEPDLEPPIDMGGDACCINVKNRWIEALRETYAKFHYSNFPEEYPTKLLQNESILVHGVQTGQQQSEEQITEGIVNKYEEMTCDEFRLSLEQFAGLQPGLYADYDDMAGSRHRWESTLARQLLQEWDECSQEAAPEGSTVDMWRTDDSFEAGWGHIAKKHRHNAWSGW